MNKLKINSGVASVILLGCLFSGWQTLLIVVVLMLIFCDLSDSIKQIMVKIITFYFGITLFSTAWDLIVSGVNLFRDSLNELINVINGYLTDPISIYKLDLYLLTPVSKIVSILDGVVGYLLIFIKFAFMLAVLNNRAMKENFIVKKVNDYVQKIINFINSFDIMQNNNQKQPFEPQNFDVHQTLMNQQNNGNNFFSN